MSNNRTFPKVLYIGWNDETGEPFLVAEKTAHAHANMHRSVRVALYKFEAITTVQTRVEVIRGRSR